MDALKDAASPEYQRAIQAAKNTLRYAVARWGYSTSLAAWEYWNEMNPGLPTDRFYSELGDYLGQTDPYHHLRRTSTWGPSPKDCQHPNLDVADVHFYLRPADKGRIDDEVHAIVERTQWLRKQAPDKPAQLGEFGLADDKWAITEEMKRSAEVVDAHSALWASALSGAAGTAMFWWWERLDQRNFYTHYKPLSRFVADVPWNSGRVALASVDCSTEGVRVLGLKAQDQAWLWLYHRESAWANAVSAGRTPTAVTNAIVVLKDMPAGLFRVRWSDTREGGTLREESLASEGGILQITAPPFTHDVACRVAR
jgi:hypothetical protein